MTYSWWILWKTCYQVSTILTKPELVWLLIDEYELSVDMETKLFVQSLTTFWLCFINVDDAPFLVDTIVSWMGNNFLSFLVLSAIHIKTLFVIDILDECTIELEHLPPSTTDITNQTEDSSFTIAADLHAIVVRS